MRPLAAVEADCTRLVESVDSAMQEAVRRGGPWIACRPGCCECCRGPVEISPLDEWRLARGLAALRGEDPSRAAAIAARAAALVEETDDSLCPALDPHSLTCDLYAWRPLLCRIFGPATRPPDGPVSACELCYQGASDDQIVACAVTIDVDTDEARLSREMESAAGRPTPASPLTIAAALRRG